MEKSQYYCTYTLKKNQNYTFLMNQAKRKVKTFFFT